MECAHKNAFVPIREATDAELPAGMSKPKSHFGKACDKLGIEIISANSPPAEGWREWNSGVYQDWFVKELRFSSISTPEEANRLREQPYLEGIHGKFARPAADRADTPVPLGESGFG